jgi:hypothetical protein
MCRIGAGGCLYLELYYIMGLCEFLFNRYFWIIDCQIDEVLLQLLVYQWGCTVAQLFEALRSNPEGHGFDSL